MHKWMVVICGFLLAQFAVAQEHRAHEHGVADLAVVLEGRRLSIELDGPLDNFVGFEHAPRTAEERATLEHVLGRLHQPETVAALPPAAGCVLSGSEVPDPFAAKQGEVAGHADLEASYQVECANPAALKRLEVRLFDAFPRLRKLRAAVVAPGGQSGAELAKGKAILNLAP